MARAARSRLEEGASGPRGVLPVECAGAGPMSGARVWAIPDAAWRALLEAFPAPAGADGEALREAAEGVGWESQARASWQAPLDDWLGDALEDPRVLNVGLGLLPLEEAGRVLGATPAVQLDRLGFGPALPPGLLPAWEALQALLGVGPGPHTAPPWFVVRSFGEAAFGVLDPARVSALVGALRQTGLLATARAWHQAALARTPAGAKSAWSVEAVAGLERFLLQAGVEGPEWLVAVEGRG